MSVGNRKPVEIPDMPGKVSLPGMEDRTPLTKLQAKVYVFVREYAKRHRRSPTCQEISTHLNKYNANVGRSHLIALQRKGYLTLAVDGRRTRIRLLDGHGRGVAIPVLTAGIRDGKLVVGEQREYLRPGEVFNDANVAAVRVRGSRLVEAGLRPGDFALVDRRPEVRHGRRAVGIVNGKLVVLRRPMWKGCKDAVRWEAVAGCPADQDAIDAARVLGELRGVIRKI